MKYDPETGVQDSRKSIILRVLLSLLITIIIIALAMGFVALLAWAVSNYPITLFLIVLFILFGSALFWGVYSYLTDKASKRAMQKRQEEK